MRLTNKKSSFFISLGIFSFFLLLLYYFTNIDIYHHAFFTSGPTIILYNLARVSFIAYLTWLFYAVGDQLLRRIIGSTYRDNFSLESALLGFFSGVGIWHIALLCIGFAGFYTRTVMASISCLVLAISLPRMQQWIRYTRPTRSSEFWLLIPLFAFLLTKGLYPAGGHDYYTHYFSYYKQVTESGSLLPNNVWYHFYYSKGDALFFLAMLLTDPLGPQLATTAMIFAGTAVIIDLIKQSTSTKHLPLIGAALYLTFLIYTPGPLQNLRQGGWGDLEKSHEPAAVLILAILWLSANLFTTQPLRRFGVTLLLSTSALVLISPTMGMPVGLFLGMIGLFCLFTRQFSAAKWFLVGATTAVAWFIVLLLINYFLTGIPEDQGLLTYWPIINFTKVNEWGVLFELLVLHWHKTTLVIQQVPFSSELLWNIIHYLRLDIWGPLFALAITLLLFKKRMALKSNRAWSLCCLFLLFIVLLSLAIGRDQPISFYRFTSFTYAPMLCVCLLMLAMTYRPSKLNHSLLILACFAMLAHNLSGGNFSRVLRGGFHFAMGHYSLKDAYSHQRGWPGRMPWGGIYPAAQSAWSILPPNTRIWSLHIHSYCMLPDCNMQAYLSNRLSPHADVIYYGNPIAAKEILKKEGLNYFFISNSLKLTDPLPLSPIFSPAHIADTLGIVWTDGNSSLLTWKEDATTPIDSRWLARYNHQVVTSEIVKSFPYHDMKTALKRKQPLVSHEF